MRQLECKNLQLGYENNVLVNDLNFIVDEGDYLCIVGENGAGKSTLMRTILQLQKPLAGNVILDSDLKENKLGKKPFYSKEHRALAKMNMQRLGIEDLSTRCYRNLSGGQQQRVLLARALCATEKILLLDEPVAGLDPMVTNEMYELIKILNDQGITIIMISHDIAAALKYAKHILHINSNYFYGTIDEYKRSSLGSAYLSGGALC